MAVSMDLVKELRERTGIGMMECKKALEQTDGDIEQAIEDLRKKWLAKAAKKADREALEWGIEVQIENGKAYVVSISCETDFLANTDKFQAMLQATVDFLKENGPDSKEQAQEMINSNYSLEMGENIQIKDYEVIEGWALGQYTHSNRKIAAVAIADDGGDASKLQQVSMHITATNPEYLSPEDISDDVVEKEKQIQLESMKNDPSMANKPDEVLMKIIDGKMGKFKSEVSLLEQPFVVDPSTKVKDFLGDTNLTDFRRYSI